MHRGPDRRGSQAPSPSPSRCCSSGRPGCQPAPPEDGAAAWRGFVDGDRAAIAIGQRMIVVLRNPSLADRLAEAGGTATESAMRQWTAGALARRSRSPRGSRGGHPDRAGLRLHAHVQRLLGADRRPRARPAGARRGRRRGLSGPGRVSRRAVGAVLVQRGFAPGAGRRARSGSRGSTAAASPSRCSTPASTSRIRSSATGCSRGSTCSTPSGAGWRGRTRTSRRASSATGRRSRGLDRRQRPGRHPRGRAGRLDPADPRRGLAAQRRAGSRSTDAPDQLLAGIERAVDPDTDGDVLDAVRVAVVGVTEPFASFPDGPLAQGDRRSSAPRHPRRRAGRQRGPGGADYGASAAPGAPPLH